MKKILAAALAGAMIVSAVPALAATEEAAAPELQQLAESNDGWWGCGGPRRGCGWGRGNGQGRGGYGYCWGDGQNANNK